MAYIISLVALVLIFIGYRKLKSASNQSSQNGTSWKTKIFGIVLMVLGLLLSISALGMFLVSYQDQEKLKRVVSELKLLGVSTEDPQTVKSALIFMPQGSTVQDYLELDKKAKVDGYKSGYDFLLTDYRAKKEGLTVDQYLAKKLTEQKAKSVATAEPKEVARIPSNSQPTSTGILMPKGEFWTDRGQVSVEVYRHACKNAYLSRQSIVSSLSVAFSASPEGKLASNLGTSAISNTKVWWSEDSSKCYGSFTISGMVNGSSYNINKSGAVYGFDPDSSGGYLAHISLY